MPEDEIQQQPTGEQLPGAGSAVENDGSGQQAAQPEFQRVTPEEAATLDFAELKRRMREERRLYEEGLLPQASAPESTSTTEEEDTPDEATGTEGRDSEGNQRSGGQEAGGTSRESELERLARQAREENQRLADENRKMREEAEREKLEAQHRRVEEAIARLPEQQQALARQDYMNRLGQQALNNFHQYLTKREEAIRQAEIAQARQTLPNLLSELAESVAQRHGVKPDRLKEYVTSPQFRELLDASATEEALTAAAANAGQWMDFLALQEANRLAAEREARRQRAAAKPQQRDTPNGGVPTAGGELDLVRRINTMTREEFFAWKKQQLREANA